jgi:hypothetical protein
MKRTFLALALLLTTTSLARAGGHLSNQDSKKYKIKVVEGGQTRTTTINPNGYSNPCMHACTITLVNGGGSVALDESSDAVISHGKIQRR